MKSSRSILGMLAAALTGLIAGPANADDIRVYSGGAPQIALRTMTPDFEKAAGHQVHFTFALVTAIQQKLEAGDKADLIMLPIPLLAAVEKSTPLRTEGRSPLARVGIGVIVRAGAPVPDVSSAEAVKTLLLGAGKIAIPEPGTPSGAHLAHVIEQFGLADQLRSRLVVRAAINGGADAVARGEADVGFYLLSEVQSIKGITVAGLLPAPLQSFVAYGTAIPVSNSSPAPAVALVKYLTDPGRSERWKAAGFELITRP